MNDTRITGTEALEQAENQSFRQTMRFYGERVAFTRRGNFAFVVGMLYSIYYYLSTMASQGVPFEQTAAMALPVAAWETFGQILTGGLLVLNGILAGVVVLLLLDLYEREMGLTIEAEH